MATPPWAAELQRLRLGARPAAPEQVYVICGDGGYLMNNHEIITSIQEGVRFTILLLNNNGYASIGGLSESIGSEDSVHLPVQEDQSETIKLVKYL